MNEQLSSDELLDIITARYDLRTIDYCMFVERGFNDTYLIEAAGKKYIGRLYLNGKYYIASHDAYRFELDLLQHLADSNVPVAAGVRARSGHTVERVPTRHGDRAFALFHFADGLPLRRHSLTAPQSQRMGMVMAQMHKASDAFESSHERYRLDQTYLIDEPIRLISEGEKTHPDDPDVKQGRQIIEKLQPLQVYRDRLDSIGEQGDRFGFIHADFHLGNLHFRGNDPTVFDFDHCAYGWRAYDLAISYYLPEARRNAMIEGYESVRTLSVEERDSLKDLANLRNLWNIGDILATRVLRE